MAHLPQLNCEMAYLPQLNCDFFLVQLNFHLTFFCAVTSQYQPNLVLSYSNHECKELNDLFTSDNLRIFNKIFNIFKMIFNENNYSLIMFHEAMCPSSGTNRHLFSTLTVFTIRFLNHWTTDKFYFPTVYFILGNFY